jgi:DNA polymerase-4
MDRLIAHIDMDAFYASVELLRYPELRGRAVVIGGGRDSQPRKRADGSHEFATLRHYAGRGVVTTSTYEARKLGVFSAMGMMKSEPFIEAGSKVKGTSPNITTRSW